MSSSMRTRFTLEVAGQPYPFAQPFVQTFLTLEEDPAQYQVLVAANSVATIWDEAPTSTFDFIALQADRDCHVEFTVDGGQSDEYHFTVFVRGGGFPVVIPGGQSYAGQTGSQSAFTNGTLKNITRVKAFNPDTVNSATVSAFVAKAA